MLTWIPIVINDAPSKLGKGRLPSASAAAVGSNLVFRFAYFEADAGAWIEANRAPDE